MIPDFRPIREASRRYQIENPCVGILSELVRLGAFAVNAGTQAPVWTAAAVATGNTLEGSSFAVELPRFEGLATRSIQ